MVNDQDGPNPEDHETDNTCTVATDASTGRVKLTLDLDPLSGGKLKQALADEENRLFNQDQEDGTIRTASNRRAEAAANLIERGAGRTETTAKPVIHVVMSLKVLLHALAQMAYRTSSEPAFRPWGAETLTRLPHESVYAQCGRLRREGNEARVVTMSTSTDLDRKCREVTVAGCDALVHWLQGDHRTPYSATQETTLAELDMLCRPDNLAKGDGPPLAERRTPKNTAGRSLWEL